MAMTPPTNLDKAAVLLRRLPPTSLTKVLEMIGVEKSAILQKAISNVANRTDIGQLDTQVLNEFREMQREIKESLRGSPQLESVHSGKSDVVPPNTTGQETASASNSNPTGAEVDPVVELTNVPPAVLAAALQKETLRSTTLVLRELPKDYTGKVLELLPAETRQQIFMLLALKSTTHRSVVNKVLKAVVDVCKTIDLADVAEKKDERFDTLIGILQSVEREERLRLMEALSEQDEELAAQIDDSLYDYSDILRIQDRSVQKLLTQLELKIVALALKTAPQEITDKVMGNLSERVRGALAEEMELLSNVAPAKMEQARKEIANVIRLQDKDGTLQWIE